MTTHAFGQLTRTLEIDVWSDVMCPFCYLGDIALARALEKFPYQSAVTVRHHSYQLMPELPDDHPVDLPALLAERAGVSRAQAIAMNEQVAERGKEFGLEYRFDRAQTINTRTAHRLIQHAATENLQRETVDRLFRAYFTDGLNVADRRVLADLAEEVGLDRAAAVTALDSEELDRAIDADISRAAEMGISGVPFFVLDNRYGLAGAQSVDAFLQALGQAWNEQETR